MGGARDRASALAEVLREAIRAHERMAGRDAAAFARAVDVVVTALRSGGKVLAFGNGGSAADAQHLAAELVGRFTRDRAAYAAIALSVDTSVLTSVANDVAYERVFARQVEALGRPGDVAVAITTSGASPNVVAGIDEARRRGLTTIALTGRDGGEAGRRADIHVNVAEHSTARAQEVHRTLLHALCEIVEEELS